MADNLLKQYMAGGMMKKENKMGHGGYMPEAPKDKKVVIMQEGNMMPSEAPEKEMNKEVEGVLMQLVEILKSWQDGEYESVAQKADMLAQSVPELIQSYVE